MQNIVNVKILLQAEVTLAVYRYHRMMISKVKPLHDKVVSTTSAVDNAEHKMATLDSKRKALEVRLKDLAKGFEDATIDKNDQEEKTVKMDRMLGTAANLRQVWPINLTLFSLHVYSLQLHRLVGLKIIAGWHLIIGIVMFYK